MVSSNSNLVFVVEDIDNQQQQIVHAQHMIPYPSTACGNLASHELREQATHHNTSYHLVKDIRDVHQRKGQFQMLVNLLGFDEGQD